MLRAGADDTSSSSDAGSEADLAKKLANPVADLISVPFQFNYNDDIGPADGWQMQLNIQPVIPIELNKEWNVISRTILPVIDQHDIAGFSGDQSGLGDTTQSFFLSPQAPTAGGLIWGFGPALLIPTGTDELLGTGKWGAGPTGVALAQNDGWTYGILANQIWSFAGQSSRQDVNAAYMQPFVAYTWPTATTLAFNTESSYDWEADDWSVPLNLMLSQIVKIGKLPVSLQGGLRYWADSTPTGPEQDNIGFRFAVTFLFPR